MQTRTYIKSLVVATAVVLFSAGCGGGSSDGAGADPGFSDNLSGVWNGAFVFPGGTQAMVMTINQPVSGSVVSVRNAQGLSGTLSTSGDEFPMTGTKDANDVTMQVTIGPETLTMTGALSSENNMNGNFTVTGGVSGTWFLTR